MGIQSSVIMELDADDECDGDVDACAGVARVSFDRGGDDLLLLAVFP